MEDTNLEQIVFSEKLEKEEDKPPLRKSPSIDVLHKRMNILKFLAFLVLLLVCIVATIIIFIDFALVIDCQTRMSYLQKQIDELFLLVKK